jgi:hypothetical protein
MKISPKTFPWWPLLAALSILASMTPAAAAQSEAVSTGASVASAPPPSADDAAAQASTPPPTRPPSPRDAFVKGGLSVTFRFRYEYYAQGSAPGERIDADARAPTARVAVGYETKPYRGARLFAEYEWVGPIGSAQYRIPTVTARSAAGLPVILDPQVHTLNQLVGAYSTPTGNLTVRVGRQELLLNDGRFVSQSLWRQHHQTFNAVTATVRPRPGVTAFYAYLRDMHRVVGGAASDGRVPMNSHLANVVYTRPGIAAVTAYAYLLDNRDRRLPAGLTPFFNSTKTYGTRVEGPLRLNDSWSVPYTVEFARQTDHAGNPYRVGVNYGLVRLGAAYRGVNVEGGYVHLQGRSATNTFQTPLGHPQNGWIEKFLVTPSAGAYRGLRIGTAAFSTDALPVPGLGLTVAFYDYWADQGGGHYGRELDASLNYRVVPGDGRWRVGWRFGRYRADQLLTNSLRTSLFTTHTF